jgi:hypothetical protein
VAPVIWTRRKTPAWRVFEMGTPPPGVAHEIGLSIKMIELVVRGIRKYTSATTTSELVRVIVEALGGLI